MFQLPAFEETRTPVLLDLLRSHPLALLVASGSEGLVANHLPLQWVAGGSVGLLRGHAARANREWATLPAEVPALAVFQGPNAYVSPAWYPSKAETHREVPTWNYVAVHVEGVLRQIHDPEWLVEHLSSLTDQQEAAMPEPWAVTDAPEDFVASLVSALVGLELEITAVRGRWKASQNRSPRDRDGALAQLEAGSPAQRAMAEAMRAAMHGHGP